MSEPVVAIIGCGPSGMVIAHACHQLQVDFTIYAPKRPSFISGAQYLHSDIEVRADGIKPKTIRYVRRGTSWVYKDKIYGRQGKFKEIVTSWGLFGDEEEAWPLIKIYHWLWEQYASHIVDQAVTWEFIKLLVEDGKLVFSTAPLRHLLPTLIYQTEKVQIVNGICFAEPDTIVYNGEPGSPWYRSSNLWGHMSIEYPERVRVPREIAQYGLVAVEKPLSVRGLDIPGVILSGRYGRWEKGVLVDESYHQAIAEIKSRL